MLFLRGDFGDTIKIWTPGMEWMFGLEEFRQLTTKSNFGVNVFPKQVDSDGRTLVAIYNETLFIFRNDSLFEIVDKTESLPEWTKLFDSRIRGLIDDSTYEKKSDSLHKIQEVLAEYVPKLIFCKGMFKGKIKKVRLSKKINFLRDEIELEKEWIQNSKKCYLVRINNKWEGQETSYAYAINEDLEFVWWQGCPKF